MTRDRLQDLRYIMSDIWGILTYPYYRLKAQKLNCEMSMAEMVLFLKKYGFKILEVKRMVPNREDIDTGKIVFERFSRRYTIDFQNKRFKRLLIKDSNNHHTLCCFDFQYLEYDNCYPMTYGKNDNIAFSTKQKFSKISNKWKVDDNNCFRVLVDWQPVCDVCGTMPPENTTVRLYGVEDIALCLKCRNKYYKPNMTRTKLKNTICGGG